jgi:hypothetical protein
MQPCPDPRRRLILAHLEHTTGGLRSGPNAPPRDEGAGERGIREVDRYRVIQYPARPRRRHHPTISAAVLVQPIGDLRVPLAETAWRDADPDADREEALGCVFSSHVWSSSPFLRCERNQARLLDPPHRPTPNIAPSWNVAPTDPLPIVRYDAKAGERSLDVMRWGLVPYWAKDIKVGFANVNAKPGDRKQARLPRDVPAAALSCAGR